MNVKRMVVASLLVFVAVQAMDYLINMVILMPSYKALAHIWRPDMQSKMWLMTLASFIGSFLFVYIFIKGYENKGIMEGFRYGTIIGLFMNVVGALNQYVIYPLPLALVIKWFIYGMIEFIIMGIIAALVYKK